MADWRSKKEDIKIGEIYVKNFIMLSSVKVKAILNIIIYYIKIIIQKQFLELVEYYLR
tara:strand:+ start:344 stop:517 length:174 start_codon:yes stop_codon:yes gene_type:complete